MRVIHGDMFEALEHCDVFFISGSGMLDKNGELIMTNQASKAVLKYYGEAPNIPKVLGKKLKGEFIRNKDGSYRYGLLYSGKKMGVIQSRAKPDGDVRIGFITYAAKVISELHKETPDRTIYMTIPGTGKDGLSFEKVLMEMAPYLNDNVFAWTKVHWTQREQYRKVAQDKDFVAWQNALGDPDDIFYNWDNKPAYIHTGDAVPWEEED